MLSVEVGFLTMFKKEIVHIARLSFFSKVCAYRPTSLVGPARNPYEECVAQR